MRCLLKIAALVDLNIAKVGEMDSLFSAKLLDHGDDVVANIRAQRTRWASCSANGRMSFNWRLLLAPERVVEYVVWHEVCHLEVLDHSRRFWALLERHWPDYRTDREWLCRNGATLVL